MNLFHSSHNVTPFVMERFFPALLLASAPILGAGISCYVCNSRQDARCLDPFHVGNATGELTTVDCEQENSVRAALETVANLMTKLGQAPAHDSTDLLAHAPNPTETPIPTSCQKIDITVLGERVTGRGCSVHQTEGFNPCDAVKLITTTDVQLDYCGVCSEDGCNSATGYLPSYCTLMVIALVYILRITIN